MNKPHYKPGATSLRRYCTPQKRPAPDATPARETLPKLPKHAELWASLCSQMPMQWLKEGDSAEWLDAILAAWTLLKNFKSNLLNMPTPFTSEDIIQVNRPHKDYHGWVGRFIDYSSDPTLAFVSFRKRGKADTSAPVSPPDVKTFRKREHADVRLFPVARLTKYTPTR